MREGVGARTHNRVPPFVQTSFLFHASFAVDFKTTSRLVTRFRFVIIHSRLE